MPGPIISVGLGGQIDYDFSRFEKESKLTQVGVAVQTRILDTALLKYLSIHPDAVVINLRAGLDTNTVVSSATYTNFSDTIKKEC